MAVHLAVCLLAGVAMAEQRSEEFAERLVTCIREHAKEAALSVPIWGSACMAPTEKIDHQAAVYKKTLNPIRNDYGYAAALWCAFFSVRMTGAEYCSAVYSRNGITKLRLRRGCGSRGQERDRGSG